MSTAVEELYELFESDEKSALTLDGEVDLDILLTDFVNLYAGMKQRGKDWYDSMGTTCGGSEMSALMGKNPYSTIVDVINKKIEILQGINSWNGGAACWWGTLFEDVIESFVSIDLGGEVKGTDICIRELPGHRNSPDGYVVARFYRGIDGELYIWTTDMDPDIPPEWRIVLLEFKCPYGRKPIAGKIPPQYRPQLKSGLMVSSVAHFGLFVDAVYRKCGILDMKDTPDYDTDYHARDRGKWDLPIAWGMIAVYAPLLDAPRRVRLGWKGDEWAEGDPDPDKDDADAAQAAWEIHSRYFGMKMGKQDGRNCIIDLGDMEEKLFNRTLGLIDGKRFSVKRVAPCFVDGRGTPLHTDQEVGDKIKELRQSAPPDHYLLGILPWKMFEVIYVPINRDPGFEAMIMPIIEEVHRTAAAAIASGDTTKYMSNYRTTLGIRLGKPEFKPTIGEDSIQDLFDSIAPPPE